MSDETKIEVGSEWRRKDGSSGVLQVKEVGSGPRAGMVLVDGVTADLRLGGWVGVNYWLATFEPCDTDEPEAPPQPEPAADPVEHPPHYHYSAVEPFAAIEAWGLGYHLGNVVAYIARHEHKGSPVEDLKKARVHLSREIDRLSEAAK